MKPKEFDELVRQKFDQGDFAYKSGSWDSLAEQLEGRAKKRSIIMWWWMPLAGMAASVALALGVTSIMRQDMPAATGAGTRVAHTNQMIQAAPVAEGPVTILQTSSSHKEVIYAAANNNNSKKKATGRPEKNISDWFHIRLNDATLQTAQKTGNGFDFLVGNATAKAPVKNKKEPVVVKEGFNTFKPAEEEEVKKMPVVSITLLGGYNQGNQSTGYMAGATFRRMLNDKVYIESDVAFSSSSNTQATEYLAAAPGATTGHAISAKNSNVEAGKATTTTPSEGVIKTEDQNYNLYYAQVSPAIGYKIISRMSIGLGPDFQRVLVDNRPAVSTVDRGNIQVAPLFDVGFVGKTEYSLTKRVKAAVSYRKGMNNIITPMDKYIDRDYLQFQIRCTIFNK